MESAIVIVLLLITSLIIFAKIKKSQFDRDKKNPEQGGSHEDDMDGDGGA